MTKPRVTATLPTLHYYAKHVKEIYPIEAFITITKKNCSYLIQYGTMVLKEDKTPSRIKGVNRCIPAVLVLTALSVVIGFYCDQMVIHSPPTVAYQAQQNGQRETVMEAYKPAHDSDKKPDYNDQESGGMQNTVQYERDSTKNTKETHNQEDKPIGKDYFVGLEDDDAVEKSEVEPDQVHNTSGIGYTIFIL